MDVKCEGPPQLSPQAALGFDLLFNCSELDITHTPNSAKIFLNYFQRRLKLRRVGAMMGAPQPGVSLFLWEREFYRGPG